MDFETVALGPASKAAFVVVPDAGLAAALAALAFNRPSWGRREATLARGAG
jgi:hypothetical protein